MREYKASELNLDPNRAFPQELQIGKRVVKFLELEMNKNRNIDAAIYKAKYDDIKVRIIND